MEAYVLYDFEGEDFSVEKGQSVNVMSLTLYEGRYKCERHGYPVMLPTNYIQMKDHDWYVGEMTKDKAEQVLSSQPDGAFLIRNSDTSPGDFELAVVHEGHMYHFKVLRDGAGKYFFWLVKFDSLNELVRYHRTSSLDRYSGVFLKTEVTRLATVMYTFEARSDDEISLEKGEKVTFTKEGDEGWVKVHKSDMSEGLAPFNYLKPAYLI